MEIKDNSYENYINLEINNFFSNLNKRKKIFLEKRNDFCAIFGLFNKNKFHYETQYKLIELNKQKRTFNRKNNYKFKGNTDFWFDSIIN